MASVWMTSADTLLYEEYGHGGWHLLQCVENAMPTLTT